MNPPGLSVSALRDDRGAGCAVVSLAGRVVIADGAWFHRLLELPEARGPGRVILDLSQLSSIDWWSALILLWTGRRISRHGGTLVLAAPQPAVARLLAVRPEAGAVALATIFYGIMAITQAAQHPHEPAA